MAIDAVIGEPWDLIITVCDQAREACPVFPGRPPSAHWGMDDPSALEEEDAQRHAFRKAIGYLDRRIDLLLALPVDGLDSAALQKRVQQIAELVPV